jgi:hypothetical protein
MIDNKKLKPLKVMYLSIEYISNLYSEGKEIDYKNIGIILDLKIDLCIFMYKEFKPRVGRSKPLVNPNSFDLERKRILEHLIEYIITNVQLGKSYSSIGLFIQQIRFFILWSNSYSLDFILSIENTRITYIQYIIFLKMSLRNGNYKNSYCYYSQINVSAFLKKLHNDDKSYITAGVPKIPKGKLNDIEISDEDDKKYAFSFYTKLFDQLNNFLINNKLYPFQLELPNNSSFWVLPSSRIFTNKQAKDNAFFCEKEGKYFTLNEMKELKNYIRDYNRGQELLKEGNMAFSAHRIYLATKAMQAYYIHFLTITGMNDSVVGRLFWNNEYKIEKNKQKFSSIKYRANNKNVEFQLQSKFISRFHDFLKIRDYALNGRECEHLFFNVTNNKISIPKNQFLGKLSSQINRIIKKTIDNNLPIINSKQLRINKTNYVEKEDGVINASKVMQTSLSVSLNHYITENSDNVSMQFTKYFEKLNKNIFATDDDNLIETAIGQCRSIDNPVSEIKNTIFKTDCKQIEGCLFCEKYACHADELDLRKLYSLLFVIQEVSINAKNLEHFERVYGNVIIRANSIINEIIAKDGLQEIANKVKEEVFEYEDLYPYWEEKLKTLYNMGVI